MPQQTDDIQSVAFVSLGCAKNLVDSERMLGLLAADGIAVTPDEESADAIVINTCGFLEASKTESLAEINRAIDLKNAGHVKRVIVAGCLVQRHKTKLLADAPGIDRLVGVFDREHIVDAVRGAANPRQAHGHYLGNFHSLSSRNTGFQPVPDESTGWKPVLQEDHASQLLEKQRSKKHSLKVFEDDRARLRLTPRHFAYLRMSEGCNQGCAFCTIPSIRGPMRSKPVEQILAEGNELAADGAVELLLIGQDTTSYGVDSDYAPGLTGLLKALDKQLPADVAWIRLMYAYPSCFTDEMIDAMAAARRVVKYIDMPLQHINDDVLARMKRKVTRQQTETLLTKLRDRVPGIAIRTTFIAGSPGETEAEHHQLVQFVKDFGFDAMGVFPYSPEPGTPMGRMKGQLPADEIQARVEELMLAQQDVAFNRAAEQVGRKIEVLVDAYDAEQQIATARTAGQAPDIDACVFVQSKKPLHPGEMLTVKVADYQAYDLIATVPQKRSLSVMK